MALVAGVILPASCIPLISTGRKSQPVRLRSLTRSLRHVYTFNDRAKWREENKARQDAVLALVPAPSTPVSDVPAEWPFRAPDPQDIEAFDALLVDDAFDNPIPD
eukprot:313192-Heterocapsa_arctica.AAC.1